VLSSEIVDNTGILNDYHSIAGDGMTVTTRDSATQLYTQRKNGASTIHSKNACSCHWECRSYCNYTVPL